MGQHSVPPVPPLAPPSLPPPAPEPPPGSRQVRCAGCHGILAVAPGMMEFICPKCQLPQMLPPELLGAPPPRRAPPKAQGIDPTKIQLPCARCKAILNVPHGLARFNCPQCGVDLAVDLSKLQQYFPTASSSPAAFLGFPPVPPEEINEANQFPLFLF
ncbi:hypothetical protein BHE74_00010433 [Ensete ventricosum]|nr:hypothetical protein BHE74_00010433 [Ensete ventricosum]RZR78502.1 hypothetical protein BHM03_00003866 [Ensete ventricosum]